MSAQGTEGTKRIPANLLFRALLYPQALFQVTRDLDITLKSLILGALREKYPTLGIEDDDLRDLQGQALTARR